MRRLRPRAARAAPHGRILARQRAGLRKLLQRALLGEDLVQRVEALETHTYESREEAWERSRTRWRAAQPDAHLTWAVELDGDAFVAKVAEHGGLAPDRRLVEVGPGYGRLLAACLARGEAFRSYCGVDLSHDNVAHLRRRFPQDNVAFVVGDIESVDFREPVDTVISSLTFKHLFPSFEPAVRNIANQLAPGGLLIFDLIEGHRRYFEDDGATYIRWYSRQEVADMLAATGLELAALDEVRHLPEMARLLVVGRKASVAVAQR